jgi:hypothetical protein
MPHTKSRYMQDQGFNDARIFLGIGDLTLISGTAPFTKNAFGDYSFNLGNSATCVFAVNIANAIARRLGFSEDLQLQFGGAGISGKADFQGRPDTIGSMSAGQQITPRLVLLPKGFRVLSLDFVYLVAGLALSTNSFGLAKTQFQNNIANTITSIIALAANGLQTAIQTNPYVTTSALTLANQQTISNPQPGVVLPGYLLLADNTLWLEWDVSTGASGTARVYGIDVSFEYNFN